MYKAQFCIINATVFKLRNVYDFWRRYIIRQPTHLKFTLILSHIYFDFIHLTHMHTHKEIHMFKDIIPAPYSPKDTARSKVKGYVNTRMRRRRT